MTKRIADPNQSIGRTRSLVRAVDRATSPKLVDPNRYSDSLASPPISRACAMDPSTGAVIQLVGGLDASAPAAMRIAGCFTASAAAAGSGIRAVLVDTAASRAASRPRLSLPLSAVIALEGDLLPLLPVSKSALAPYPTTVEAAAANRSATSSPPADAAAAASAVAGAAGIWAPYVDAGSASRPATSRAPYAALPPYDAALAAGASGIRAPYAALALYPTVDAAAASRPATSSSRCLFSAAVIGLPLLPALALAGGSDRAVAGIFKRSFTTSTPQPQQPVARASVKRPMARVRRGLARVRQEVGASSLDLMLRDMGYITRGSFARFFGVFTIFTIMSEGVREVRIRYGQMSVAFRAFREAGEVCESVLGDDHFSWLFD